jgi:protocatechuate 3,4-dioxygenase beta subunit
MPFRFGNVGYGLVATDERGRFEIPGLRPGRYKVTVRAPDFAVGTSDDVMVEADADAEAEVVLYRGAPITGRLVGPNEKPVAGRVTIHDDEAALPSPMGPDEMLSAETDAEGRFRVERVAPGSHVVAVVAPGFAPQRLTADVGTAGTPVDLGDVVLETGLQIRGRVRDKAGSPIADAQINGFNRRGFGGGNMLQARGEADGTFVIAGVQPGTYRLTARAYGYGEVSKSAEAGGDVVEFVMDAAGSVTGTAVDEAGRPVDAFRVTARPVVEETGMRFPPRFELIADAEGHFILDNLAPATYVLQVSAPDRADGVVSSVKIAPGATVDVGRLRLGAGGIVRGTVVDGGGTPVVGATVTARAGQSFGPQPANEAVSDGGGAFEIKGLPTGAVTVSGRHPNYADGRVTGVDVDPARGPSEVRLVLAQGGRVQGSVRRRDGAGVPNVLIQVSPMQRDGGFSFPGDNIQTTGADGTFSVDRLPAGRAKVMMLVGGAGQFQTGPSRDVEIVDGETAVADFVSQEILVSGHVMRGGAPAAGMRVNVRGEHQFGMFLSINASPVPAAPTGPQRGTATTREDGSFELLVDEPGTYHASASSADGRVSYPERQVSIPDADSFTLDLTYSGVPVAGVVVDRDTEQPVADANVFASAKDAERREATSAGGNTGADGRFFLELEPGEYTLNVRAESYAVESSELTVGSGGSSEVRLTLSRGGAIAGRLLDPNGRPAGGIYVGIRGDEDGTPRWSPGAQSLPDGSFQIANLAKGTYTLSAQSGSGMFALQTGVRPGQKDVTLTLQPGGRVQLLVRGPDGAPLEGAWASTSAVDGVKAGMGGGLQTNAQGMTDLAAPAGQVELSVRKDRLTGQTTVTVTPGGSVAAEVTLAEKPAGSSP